MDGTVEGSCYEATVRCIGVRLRALCAMGSCEDFCQQLDLLHSAVRVCGLVVALHLWLCVFLDSGFSPLADACCGPFLQPEVAGVQCDNLVVELFEAGTYQGRRGPR